MPGKPLSFSLSLSLPLFLCLPLFPSFPNSRPLSLSLSILSLLNKSQADVQYSERRYSALDMCFGKRFRRQKRVYRLRHAVTRRL